MTIGFLLGIIIYLIYTYFLIKYVYTTNFVFYAVWWAWTAYYIYRIYDAGLLDWLSYKLV